MDQRCKANNMFMVLRGVGENSGTGFDASLRASSTPVGFFFELLKRLPSSHEGYRENDSMGV